MAEYATVAFAGGGEPEQCSDFMPWHAFRANKIDYDDPNHPWVKDTDWENEIKVGNVWWGLAPFSVEILATTLPNGVREQFYRTPALTARGGKAPYQWSVDGGALPPGLRLDETSGIIEGVPTTAGQYKFLVVAWDSTFPAISADADDAEYTIIISPN